MSRATPLRSLLAPLAYLYRAGTCVDRWRTRAQRLARPVISVGNISVGGRGKTPFVVHIAQLLRARGYNPVVLTRGYGRAHKKSAWLEPGQRPSPDAAAEFGDEALEIFLRAQCAVLVGSRRAANAQRYLRERPAQGVVFVLDDGFQHWALARDFDLVLIERVDLHDRVLPAGRLREGPVALTRADLVLERGKDFEKVTRLPRPPRWDQDFAVLTTRAPDATYRVYFAEHAQATFLELRDHATGEEIFAALRTLRTERVVLGLKEAVKVLEWDALNSFLRTGHAPLLLGGPSHEKVRSIDLRLADLELRLSDDTKFARALTDALAAWTRAREIRGA